MIGGEEDALTVDIHSFGMVMWQPDCARVVLFSLINLCFCWFLLDYFPWIKVLFNIIVSRNKVSGNREMFVL